MNKWIFNFASYLIVIAITFLYFNIGFTQSDNEGLVIGDGSYFEMSGLNVLVYNNTFAEGHQSGVEIIQHGIRVATNGELRLSPSPGQWQPLPKLGVGYEARGVSPQGVELEGRVVDKKNNVISLPCSYPNESRNRKGFNPIIYPDLEINYEVSVKAEGKTFTITVDLDKPIPKEWLNRVGYTLELFPGDLYGKTYFMDDSAGIFARQAHGPAYFNETNEAEQVPFATGKRLVIAPEDDKMRMTIESNNSTLQLLDGSFKHNNGWFVVRSLIPAGVTKGAVQWKISPNVIPDWIDPPVIHLSQVGYHPKQAKTVFVELDKNDKNIQKVSLLKVENDGTTKIIKKEMPEKWGRYLRYEYLTLDFSDVTEEGMYMAQYGDVTSNVFTINNDVYKRHVWQPTLEYFLPVQMCHMRVNQKYRVWHGACHLDDALMMPLNIRHFDGYDNLDETSTLCKYKPLEHVPGLNVGGWHDAGDYDLRIESQAQTVIALALTYEEFGLDYDETYIDQKNHLVELHQPDGKPDILQQVEHGVLTILSGYRSMGQFYRGIIAPSLRQYVHLGDASTHTDNEVCEDELLKKAANIDELWYKKVANRYSDIYDPEMNHAETEVVIPGLDDRLVFMETNPNHKLIGAAALAAASRVLKNYNPDLAKECIEVAEEVWEKNKDAKYEQRNPWSRNQKIGTLIELIISTKKQEYKDQLYEMSSELGQAFMWSGASFGRVLPYIDRQAFKDSVNAAAAAFKPRSDEFLKRSPFGSTLGHAEYLAFREYYMHKFWPEIYSADNLYNIINYLLGCRPGNTTNSLVSGVGVNSPTIAYGTNRADWSYIPGGTFWAAVNLVSPDLAEDKQWPFLWQEREYIITSPCYFMFAVLGADRILEQE